LGAAIVFVCLLAALGLFAVLTAAYAANCFLVAVEQTAAGIDDVAWPDEPLVDWVGKPVFLVWMVAFWLVPTGFLLRYLKDSFLPHEPILRFLLPSAFLLWLLFPISLLSSLSAQSRLVFFRPAILVGFLRCFPSVFLFYGITLVLLAITAAALAMGLQPGGLMLAPVAAAVAAAALLIYGRLLGRVAWLLNQLQPLESQSESEPESQPAPKKKKPRKVEGLEANDPWAVPETKRKRRKKAKAKPPPTLPVAGYGLAAEEPPPLPKEPPLDGSLPVGRDARFAEEDLPHEEVAGSDEEGPGSRLEERLARRREEEPEPPAYPMLSGVFTFPWYSSMLKHWVLLGAAGTFLLVLWQMMLAFWPNG
jgi:hypothetical protein